MDKEVNEQSSEQTESEPNSSAELTETHREERVISSRWDLQETWADLEAATPTAINEGDIVEGVVVDQQDQGVVVDIGAKYEGFIPLSEFTNKEELPQPEARIEVAVIKIDEERAVIRLSKKRADYERVWRSISEAQESGEVVTAMVTARVKGGLRVDLGVPGFVPASHVATRDVRQLDKFVGKTLQLKILEADRSANQVVLSHRQVIEEERERRCQETRARLKPGVVCEGRVRNLTNYGVFIDLGGIDGLLHISEMSWTHIDHPSQIVKPGEIIRVMVLRIEGDGERISLSRRQILPDPWKDAAGKLRQGSIVTTQITRIVATGAFARLADAEIEGFIPIGEMSFERINSPDEVLHKGQQVEAKIVELRPQARKMTLSLTGAQQEQEREEYQQYMQSHRGTTITIGDQFGELLRQTKASLEQDSEESAEEVSEAPAEEPAAEPADEATDPTEDSAEEAGEDNQDN